jgi:poly(3-hydroxybutyrate) depolymerase
MTELDYVTPVRRAEVQDHVLQAGVVLERTLEQNHEQHYFLYIPRKGGAGAPVFISVHGISGNAQEHAERFAPFAERYGVVLIAPSFAWKHFPAYQRLTRPSSRKSES